MDSCANPVGSPFLRFFTSFQESWQVANQPLLPTASSRLYLCKSFPRCLVPYHDGPTECFYLFLPRRHRPSPRHYGSASRFYPRMRLSRGLVFRGCRHFVMFRPLSLLVSQIAPTAASSPTGQPRLLRPGISCFVASARSGYAIRPIQAIDGKRTFTFQDLQPCRLLQCLTNLADDMTHYALC
jgi:hypothetical protein